MALREKTAGRIAGCAAAGKRKLHRVCLLCLGVILIAGTVAAWAVLTNDFSITLTLNAEEELCVEWGTDYKEPGASAVFSGSLILTEPEKMDVRIEGTVDTSLLGTYELVYKAEKQLHWLFGGQALRATAKRTVKVVDIVPPEITLLTDPAYFTLPGQTYMEEGFTALDDHDGDLTAQVTTRVENDQVFYEVTDASGNTAQAVRQIVYTDPIPPQLVLDGTAEEIVLVGTPYVEPGYFALDNLDGDITEKVVVTGTVDHETMGTYNLEYAVSDDFGNVTTVQRTVIVRDYPELPDNLFPGQAEEPVVPEGKVIYLTFDDGPCAYTNVLLDILKKYDVKATFFVINRGYHDILKRIADEGHTLAMHCSEHNYRKIYASEEAYFADLKEIQDVIYEQTGIISTIVRFPGGSGNEVSKFNPGIMTRLTKMLDEMGYRYFDWNVGSGDAGGVHTREAVFQRVINGVQSQNVSVVLQHDIKYFSVQAVEDIIKWGLKHGYTFLPLSNNSPEVKGRLHN